MPEDVRLLAADLDGTLLTPQGKMGARTRAALLDAEAAGVQLVFATGRRQSFAMQVLGGAGLRADAVLITSNGAIVRTLDGRYLERHLLSAETARLLCQQLGAHRNAMIFTFDREGPGALVVEHLDTLHSSIAHWVEANAHEIVEVPDLERAFFSGEGPVQGMVCGTLGHAEQAIAALDADTQAARQLRAAISIHRTEYAARDLCIVDLMPQGCSKGHALARLAESRGISPAQVMAIGDNMNDVEMLEWSGRPVVMANAAEGLLALARQRGWPLAASNAEEGAAQAIVSALHGANTATRSFSVID